MSETALDRGRAAPLAVRGLTRPALDALLAATGEGSIPASERYDALARFEEMPARSVAKPGRSWKWDLAKLDFSETISVVAGGGDAVPFERDDDPSGVTFVQVDATGTLDAAQRRALAARGVAFEPFAAARAGHGGDFTAAFGRAADTRDDKFASLALAFNNGGAYLGVPAGLALEDPLVVRYASQTGAAFPYTLVHARAGARLTVIEQLRGGPGGFACGIAEIVVEDGAEVTYVVDQRIAGEARAIFTRRALLGAAATLRFCQAEFGAEHSVGRLRVYARGTGARAEIAQAFFVAGEQHVEIESEVVHEGFGSQSRTAVRSAGSGRGQGRYFGNIKILRAAHNADASLRDDALLLSEAAHVDSVPALEIAANDVKAYHGATVGSISEDEIFYAQSRGIARSEAERMIALGFFEPALTQFPGESLRAELRETLERTLDGSR